MGYGSRDAYQSVLRPRESRLDGTGRLADDLYLVAHHEMTGKPHVSSRAVGIGIAGGLLAELMVTEAPTITVRQGYVLPLHNQRGVPMARLARPDEPVTAHVLDAIMSEPKPRPVRDWLQYVGMTAAADVARRLGHSGYLTRQPSRLLRRTQQPVLVDGQWSVCALLRAHAALDASRSFDLYSALLTGLTLTCGLGFRFVGFPDAPVRAAEEVMWTLPYQLRELVAQVQTTADGAVLSSRK